MGIARRALLGARRRARALPRGRRPRSRGPRGLGAAPRRVDRATATRSTPRLAGTGLAGLGRTPSRPGRPARQVATRNAGKTVPRTPSSPSCPASSAAAPTSPATPAPRSRAPGPFSVADRQARQIHYGVREHGMGCGHERHGRPRRRASRSAAPSSCSPTTCARPVRLAALSELAGHLLAGPTTPSGVGEDGPTHQPIEHLAVAAGHARASGSSARPTPTRPPWPGASPSSATAPTALILSRQNLPVLEGTAGNDGVAKGAYVLRRHRRRPRRSC